jgi:NitT/TauT family transport system substrate-binding protein
MNRKIPFFAAALVAVIALAGCSGPSAPAATSKPAKLTTITVGVSPSTASAAVYLAEQKDFAANGLVVKLSTLQSGAQAVPQLLNGGLQFALGDTGGTISASSNGVPITATGVATVSPTKASQDYSGILTSNASIKTVSDLSGKTVAVNQLKGTAQLSAEAAIDNKGGDSSKVHFVELTFPEMVSAVASGKVDAALVVEPFLSAGKAQGMHVVLAPQAYSVPGLPSTIFVASAAYAKANPVIVAEFNKAMGQAATRLNSDPALARQISGTYTTIAPAVLKVITMPIFGEKVSDTSGTRKLVNLMNKYKYLAAQPDYKTLLLAGN